MTAPLIVIARQVAWSEVARDPESRVLRWDALDCEGGTLALRSKRPFEDGALALLDGGADPEAVVLFRHEGSDAPVFKPMKLAAAARPAAARRARIERLERSRGARPSAPARLPGAEPPEPPPGAAVPAHPEHFQGL